MSPVVGDTISRYRIVSRLGGGGMGVVFGAEDLKLGRRVALKFLPPELTQNREAVSRFQREARTASALNHPHICTIHDLGETESPDGQHFIVMEWLEGHTLKHALGDGPMPVPALIDLAGEIAAALGAAHAQGVVHRDVKPANLFVTSTGHGKVLDFGIAKLVPGATSDGALRDAATMTAMADAGVTAPGTAVGTVAYMSPEQVRGEELDPRSDLFSLGLVLYEMATGRPAFEGATAGVIADGILNKSPIAPNRLNPEVQPDLERIILKALEKDRRLRYQSASELSADLSRLRRDLDSSARSAGSLAPQGQTSSRGVSRLAWSAVLLAALGAAGWGLLARRNAALNAPSPVKTVAVLPLQNIAGDQEQDFLRFGLADEIVGVFSPDPAFAVRPFATSRRYTAPDVDLVAAGRDLGVATLVTGHYMREADDLRVTIEAVDVATDRVVWRDAVRAPARDAIAMQQQLVSRVRQGLMPALGVRPASRAEREPPRNAEAYDLYLRSTAISYDPLPNKQAIPMLERAVELDPHFARAWAALGLRSNYDSSYSDGGKPAAARSEAAYRRALIEAPDLIGDAAVPLILARVERGDRVAAYRDAKALVEANPSNARAHYALAYVLRYAGVTDESVRECRAALAIDQSERRLRTCALSSMQFGDYLGARQFARLDRGSQAALSLEANAAVREGNREDARRLLAGEFTGNVVGVPVLLKSCLQADRHGDAQSIVSIIENEIGNPAGDPEELYLLAAAASFCDLPDSAVRLARRMVTENYCAVDALMRDPMFAQLRTRPEYPAILHDARECRDRFTAGQAR